MGRRQYEDRVTAGPITVMRNGVISRGQGTPRTVPVLPPVHDAARAAGPYETGHEALSIVHTHGHSDGHGRIHEHLHSHAGDASHSPGASHPHTPGNPDASMPAAQLNSGTLAGETRDVSGFSLGEQISRYLESQGVDVAASLRDAQYAREHAARDTAAQAERLKSIARSLRKARRAAGLAQAAWMRGWSGSSWHEVVETREAVAALDGALREACVNNPATISAVKRSVAW